MLTSMCSALIDAPASPAPGEEPLQGQTGSLAIGQPVGGAADAAPADADASVDVSSVITQYLGPSAPPAKWQRGREAQPCCTPSPPCLLLPASTIA